MAIGHLIDGDPKTVTGGAFSPGHWFQIDLGAPTLLAGARLTWDVSNPEGYSLQTSLDGTQWQTAYTMADSLGDVETLYFAPRQARYLRLASPQRTSDWGVSIFEMEPLDSTLSARIGGIDATQAAALWQGGGTVPMPAGTKVDPMRSRSRCRRLNPRLVWWSTGLMAARGPARLQVQDAQGRWQDLAHDAQAANHRQSWLAANAAQAVRCIPPERGWICTAGRAPAPARAKGRNDADEAVPDCRQWCAARVVPGLAADAADLLDRRRRARRTTEIDLRRVRKPGSLQGRAVGAADLA
ncbi:MAG: discoidin domain-containing protein [Stenotrophomonas maltophilia]